MLYHILTFKFFNTATKADRDSVVKELKGLGNLPDLQIREWIIGEQSFDNPKAYDFFQYSVFDDFDHLQRYRQHPEHQRVKALLASVCEWTIVDHISDM